MERLTIVQGEHAVVGEPGVAIVTVLGSCVAVCLVDRSRRLGGMNHFLLAAPAKGAAKGADLQRYGIHAMEVLVNAMMRQGSGRTDLTAHLYGGATMIAGLGDIGTRNVDFARRFLEVEGIDIRHEDVGGRRARRIELLPYEGRSRCRTVAEPVHEDPAASCVPVVRNAGELELFA